jgi:hypothetical protein
VEADQFSTQAELTTNVVTVIHAGSPRETSRLFLFAHRVISLLLIVRARLRIACLRRRDCSDHTGFQRQGNASWQSIDVGRNAHNDVHENAEMHFNAHQTRQAIAPNGERLSE